MEYNVVVGKVGAFYALINPRDSACLNSTSRYDNLDYVMQYTGLKDKNGREIYKGDIIKIGDRVREVLGALGMFHIDEEYGDFVPISEIDNIIEVIGNIFENPELLCVK